MFFFVGHAIFLFVYFLFNLFLFLSLRFDAYIVDIYPFRWPRNILSIHLSIISLYFIIYVFIGEF